MGRQLSFHGRNDRDRLQAEGSTVIDPREFGKLEAQVEALQTEVHALRQDIKSILPHHSEGLAELVILGCVFL